MFDLRIGGIALATLAAVTTAQARVIVVDAQSRPGTHFTTVQAAVDAATHGDLIAVRAGWYEEFTADKGVAILAEPGTTIAPRTIAGRPAIHIDGLPAGTRFTLQNVGIRDAFSGGILATDCDGEIVLENVSGRLQGAWMWATSTPFMSADNAARIVLSRCHLVGAPAVRLSHCTLLASDSKCIGGDGFGGHGEFAAGVGVDAADSVVVLSRCTLEGGDITVGRGYFLDAQPALRSLRSTWTITGLPGSTITAGLEGTLPVSAIDGTGTIEIHPAIRLVPQNGAPAVAAGITLRTVPVPSLSARGDAPGGTVEVDLFSAPGDTVMLAAGFLGARTTLPGLGDFWLDSARGVVVAAAGVQDASARFPLRLPVPASAALLSVSITWQGVALPPAGPARLSNPATYVHGW